MFLPDPYRIDVQRFLESPAGIALFKVARLRMPPTPVSADSPSAQAHRYAIRDGFEQALNLLETLPTEYAPQPTEEAVITSKLTDPRN